MGKLLNTYFLSTYMCMYLHIGTCTYLIYILFSYPPRFEAVAAFENQVPFSPLSVILS